MSQAARRVALRRTAPGGRCRRAITVTAAQLSAPEPFPERSLGTPHPAEALFSPTPASFRNGAFPAAPNGRINLTLQRSEAQSRESRNRMGLGAPGSLEPPPPRPRQARSGAGVAYSSEPPSS